MKVPRANSEIETAHSREEAAVLLSQSWEIKEPTVIPEGYARMDYYVYDKDRSNCVTATVTINMSCTIAPAPARAISVETLTPTPVKRRFPANASAISSFRGSDDVWMVATWKQDGISYSISCEKGLSQDALLAMIDSIE